MKTKNFLLGIFFLLTGIFSSSPVKAQFTAGITSNPGAYLGWNDKGWVLYGAFDYLSGTIKNEPLPEFSSGRTEPPVNFSAIAYSLGIKAMMQNKRVAPYIRVSIGRFVPLENDKSANITGGVIFYGAGGAEIFLIKQQLSIGGEVGAFLSGPTFPLQFDATFNLYLQ